MPAARTSGRPLGVVYTPPELARAMVEKLLSPFVENSDADALLSLRICDPAAGEGAFLRTVVEQLGDHVARAWARAQKDTDKAARERESSRSTRPLVADARGLVAQRCIVGADTDAAALAVADRAFWDLAQIDGPTASCAKLFCADALSFDWRDALPDVFANGGFDALIANPPYIRQESLDGKDTLRAFETYSGVADYYVYFIELAHRLLRPGGRYSIIVPSKWMTAEYGRPLRSFLAASNSVDAIVDLSTLATFADADAFPCVITGTIGAPASRPVFAIRASRELDVASALALVPSAARRDGIPKAVSAPIRDGMTRDPTAKNAVRSAYVDANVTRDVPAGTRDERSAARNLHVETNAVLSAQMGADFANVMHDRALWTAGPWHITAPTERALLARFERKYPSLGEIVGTRWSRGVVTGLNDAFVIDVATRERLIEADVRAREWIRPFVKGRDVRAYRVAPTERWILLVDRGTKLDVLPRPIVEHLTAFRAQLEPRPTDHAGASSEWPGRKPGTYAWHELQDPVVPLAKSRAPRLLYQDIQTAPLCALDLAGELVPDTTVWILPSSDLVLLAILNSSVYRWISQRRFPPALNGAVRPKLQYMQQLPIPPVGADLRCEISALVERRLGANAVREDAVAVERSIATLIADAYEMTVDERRLVLAPDSSPPARVG